MAVPVNDMPNISNFNGHGSQRIVRCSDNAEQPDGRIISEPKLWTRRINFSDDVAVEDAEEVDLEEAPHEALIPESDKRRQSDLKLWTLRVINENGIDMQVRSFHLVLVNVRNFKVRYRNLCPYFCAWSHSSSPH